MQICKIERNFELSCRYVSYQKQRYGIIKVMMASFRWAGILALLIFSSVFWALSVRASTTNGTIDPSAQGDKYGWGDVMGWINFGTTQGNVHVLDSRLTGYAWSENFGWVNLSSTKAAVTNNSEGVLGGYAWGENVGYISFSGITISSSGVFQGVTATNTTAGRISFDCADCRVVTDWRPASTRGSSGSTTSSSSGGVSSGGGGGAPAQSYEKPKQPLAVSINNGDTYTNNPKVILTLTAGDNVTAMALAPSYDFEIVGQIPYQKSREWSLCGSSECPEGIYIVYVKYYTAWGQSSDPVYDTIIYRRSINTEPFEPEREAPEPSQQEPVARASLYDLIKRTIDFFTPEFLKEPSLPQPVFPIVVTQKPPASFRNNWVLLPKPAIDRFVFSPISQQVFALQKQLPTLSKLFTGKGIDTAATLPKLYGVNLVIPGLSKTVALRAASGGGRITKPKTVQAVDLQTPSFEKPGSLTTNITVAQLPSIAGIPVAKLPKLLKEKIPSEVVFARAANQKIDLDLSVKLDEGGKLLQSIQTIAGQKLDLFVKPVAVASRVSGYMVLRSLPTTGKNRNDQSIGKNDESSRLVNLSSLIDSPIFASASFAKPSLQSTDEAIATVKNSLDANYYARLNLPPGVDEKFVLQTFEYEDPDRDGIYEARVQAPVVNGEYDILTFIAYKDQDLGDRQIALTAVIDPEGYIYESFAGREIRIGGATVSIYQQDIKTGNYNIWVAQDYAQQNPQITDRRGSYAFLVPEGSYYIEVVAEGYQPYQTKPFIVQSDTAGVHMNIELIAISSSWRWFDWKVIILIAILLLVTYHVYTDRRRIRVIQAGEKIAPDLTPPLP